MINYDFQMILKKKSNSQTTFLLNALIEEPSLLDWNRIEPETAERSRPNLSLLRQRVEL